MNVVKAKLSAKYLYVRCDEDFQLNFTNGSSMPFWKGFYCLLTEDLQKYNTNNELDIVASDSSIIWWLSSDTLIMSVTDINTDLLQLVADSNLVQVQSDSLKIDLLSQQRDLLISLQNSLSTFLNAYVEANSIVDYGFQQGSIGSNGVCNVFIAKPSSVNKYSFNCKISYSGNISGIVGSNVLAVGSKAVPELSSFTGMKLTVGSGTIDVALSHPSKNIDFNIYDNSNSLLSGYSIGNVSITGTFTLTGTLLAVGSRGGMGQTFNLYYNGTLSGDLFGGVSYDGNGFECSSHASDSKSWEYTEHGNRTAVTGTEMIDIVFDVAKT